MKTHMILVLSVLLAVVVCGGCESKKTVSREEIPLIKSAIAEFETAIRDSDPAALKQLMSSEAGEVGMTAEAILDFVLGDRRTEFVGFTEKTIFFRGDVARCDCAVAGPDGPIKQATITLKKENDVWRIKKIEPRIHDSPDTD